MVKAMKNLPQQQQLLICAATKLMGARPQEQPSAIALDQSPRMSQSPFAKKVSFISQLVVCEQELRLDIGLERSSQVESTESDGEALSQSVAPGTAGVVPKLPSII